MRIRKRLAFMLCVLLIIANLNVGTYSGISAVSAKTGETASVENDGKEIAVHSESDAVVAEEKEASEGKTDIAKTEETPEAKTEAETPEAKTGKATEEVTTTEAAENATENATEEKSTVTEEDAKEQAEEAVEEVAFSDSRIVDGVIITVVADEGVFPNGTTLMASRVSDAEEAAVTDAVDEAKNDNDTISSSYTFDIKIIDETGNEIEPDTSKGNVRVLFAMSEVSNANLDTNVWHIEGEGDDLTAEKLETSESGEIVTAETTGFSYYQVEFTYGEKQYVLPGDGSVALTDILSYVGITNKDGSAATNESITSATGSDDSLFTVENVNGIWTATAVTSFSSNESLVVMVDGVEYEIVVTDATTYEYWTKQGFGGQTVDQEKTTFYNNTVLYPGDTVKHMSGTWSYLKEYGYDNRLGYPTADYGTNVSSYTIPENVYYWGSNTTGLYIWRAYKITLDYNDGTGEKKDYLIPAHKNYCRYKYLIPYGTTQQRVYDIYGGQSVPNYGLPSPTRANYTFLGWFTSSTGGTQITNDTEFRETANKTFYAHWEINVLLDAEYTAATDFTYDGTEQTALTSITNANVTSGTYNETAAGTYTFNIKPDSGHAWKGTTDVDISEKNVTWTINPKEVGLSWGTSTFTYTGDSQYPTATATGLIDGDSCDVEVSGGQSDVGTYTATASGLSNTNYKLPSDATQSFKINPCETDITINVGNMIYTGGSLAPVPVVKAVNNDNKVIDASEYTYTYTENVEHGTATITVTDKDGGNYIIHENSKTFTVIPKSIDNDNKETADNNDTSLPQVEIADFPNVTYSGKAQTPAAKITYNGKTLKEGTDYTLAYSGNVNAGTATVVITGKGNYEGTVTKTFTIEPLPITEAAENFLLTLGGTSYVYNGTAQTPEVDLTRGDGVEQNKLTLVAGTDYEITYKNSNTDGRAASSSEYDAAEKNAVDAGTITVRVTGKGNYKDYLEKTYTITKREAEVYGLTAIDKKYDGNKTIQLDTSSASLHNLVVGDEGFVSVSADATGIAEKADVGTGIKVDIKNAKLTGAYAGNYTLTSVNPVLVDIEKRELTDSMVSLAYDSVTYDGTAKTPAVTLTDMAGGENIITADDCSITYTDNVNAGTATVTITATETGNYSGSVTKTFTINKAKLIITPDEQYGAVGAALNELTYAITGNRVGEDTVTATLATTATAESSTGNYDITVTKVTVNGTEYDVAAVNDNPLYEITVKQAVYHLADYGLTVKLSDDSNDWTKAYDGNEYKVIATLTSASGTTPSYTMYYSKKQYSAAELDEALNRGQVSEDSPVIKNVGALTVWFYAVGTDGSLLAYGNKTITIEKKSIAAAVITLENDIFDYTGAEIKPEVASVILDGVTLVKDRDYTISYENNTDIAAADSADAPTVVITGIGNYKDTAGKTFKIKGDALYDEKEAAKEKLKKKYEELVDSGDYDDEGLDELKKIYDDAIDAIDEATELDSPDEPKENGPWNEEKAGEEALDSVKTAAEKVTDIIDDLPDPDDVTEDGREAIEKAREAYEALTDDQKDDVSDEIKKKLENVEKALAIKETKEKAKEELKKKYDELAESGDYDEEGLDELKKVYDDAIDAIDKATEKDTQDEPKESGPWNEEKAGEDAFDSIKTVAEKVTDIINDLPASKDVTADDKDAIEKARKAYDALTDNQKSQISDIMKKKLTDDEEALKNAKIVYSAIEGSGSNWEKGSSSGDKFVFKRNVNDYKTFSQFTGISVDQIKVDVSNYTAEAGSVIIVLKPEYLETLSVGKHTLTAMFTDAEDVTVEFEVTAKGKTTTPEATVTPPTDNNADNTNTGKKSVKTGDNMNVGMVVMIMIDTALACIYLTFKRRKIKK